MITNRKFLLRFESARQAAFVNTAIDFAETHNLSVHGHAMFWPHDNKAGAVNHDFQLPDGSFSNSDIVDQWTAAGETDIRAEWVRLASLAGSGAELYVNHFSLINRS